MTFGIFLAFTPNPEIAAKSALEDKPTFGGFSTGVGTQVHVEKSAIESAKSKLAQIKGGFSSGLGSAVTVEKSALQAAQSKLSSEKVPAKSGFSSGLGRLSF